jgi:hypothetical protein
MCKTNYIYYLVPKTQNDLIPIINHPQECSFTNGFLNIFRIEVASLLRHNTVVGCVVLIFQEHSAFIKVKPTKKKAFFLNCWTMKMRAVWFSKMLKQHTK